jgi:hypothetical protein
MGCENWECGVPYGPFKTTAVIMELVILTLHKILK